MRAQILVRIPLDELAAVDAILSRYPGHSPALIFRALLLTAPKLGIQQAVAKHCELKLKGFKP